MFASLMGVPAHGSSKSHKHGSGHNSRRSTTTNHHSKSSKTKAHSTNLPATIPLSFLFAVNEFHVDYEPLPGDDRPLTDQWLNIAPPQRADAYVGEMAVTVFRYQNGVISPAHGYVWYDDFSSAKRTGQQRLMREPVMGTQAPTRYGP